MLPDEEHERDLRAALGVAGPAREHAWKIAKAHGGRSWARVGEIYSEIMEKAGWKKCPGFPMYSVSSGGQVRNDQTGKILALPKTQDGYALVTLMRDGRKHSVHVHTLVQRAFPSGKGPDVRHLNHDKSDNSASNLRRGSRSQNMRDNSRR